MANFFWISKIINILDFVGLIGSYNSIVVQKPPWTTYRSSYILINFFDKNQVDRLGLVVPVLVCQSQTSIFKNKLVDVKIP